MIAQTDGIDISKDRLDVQRLSDGASRRFRLLGPHRLSCQRLKRKKQF
jgi:hypothetical protein